MWYNDVSSVSAALIISRIMHLFLEGSDFQFNWNYISSTGPVNKQ